MTNEERKNGAESAAPVSEEKLEGVSGGSWGYYPGRPCPACGTPLVEDRLNPSGTYRSKCPACGETWTYGR